MKNRTFRCRRVASAILWHECQETGHPGFILIGQKYYEFQTVHGCGLDARNCFRVREHDSPDAEQYTVTEMADGREDCDCADFVYVAGPQGNRCKHLWAFTDCRLIGAAPCEPNEPCEVPF